MTVCKFTLSKAQIIGLFNLSYNEFYSFSCCTTIVDCIVAREILCIELPTCNGIVVMTIVDRSAGDKWHRQDKFKTIRATSIFQNDTHLPNWRDIFYSENIDC